MKPRRPIIPLIAVSLLLIPFIGMQISKEVDWSALDFIVMGLLLLAAGIGTEWILRKNYPIRRRIILIGIIILVFLLIWIELAVGIF